MKTRIFTTLVALLAVLSLLLTGCGGANRERPTRGLEFESINHGKSYKVTGIGTVTDNVIVIPSTYRFRSVTSIGQKAFWNCYNLTSVTLPDGVTVIGTGAFANCISLTDITVPGSVTEIGMGAFDGCLSLKDVYYDGTTKDWLEITLVLRMMSIGNTGAYTVHCTDGDIKN